MKTGLTLIFFLVALVCSAFAQPGDKFMHRVDVKSDPEAEVDASEGLDEPKKPEGMDDYSWRRARKANKLQMADNEDILFYGRVLGPDRKPIAGVEVIGEVTAYDGGFLKVFMKTDKDRKIVNWTATTDVDGRFVANNMRGLSLKVTSIEKAGYYAPPSQTIYLMSEQAYGHHAYRANIEQPVDFILWPYSAAAGEGELVKKFVRAYGRGNDVAYRFDIISGKHVISESDQYDLSVMVQVPETTAERRIKHDWSLTITAAPDSGLAPTSEFYAYQAPYDGYVNQILVEVSKSSPDWDECRRLKLYIKGRGGQVHAAVSLSAYSYHDGEVLIEIESVTNKTGSVNLMPPLRGK